MKSMTGYGKGEVVRDGRHVTIEIKSVNHRYLDMNVKLPRKCNFLEQKIREAIKKDVRRGKVDVYINLQENADVRTEVCYNKELAEGYLNILRQMSADLDLRDDITVSMLSRYPDVLEVVDVQEDEDVLESIVFEALEKAVAGFVSTRESEGERLKVDLTAKLKELEGYVDFLEERSPKLIEDYRNRLFEKVSTVLEEKQIDEGRILQEVTIYADKICIDEEMVRLRSHIKETLDTFELKEDVGRKLDFIAQELNRESNTILSKSTDVEIADVGVSIKTLIEKIREQIQNIE